MVMFHSYVAVYPRVVISYNPGHQAKTHGEGLSILAKQRCCFGFSDFPKVAEVSKTGIRKNLHRASQMFIIFLHVSPIIHPFFIYVSIVHLEHYKFHQTAGDPLPQREKWLGSSRWAMGDGPLKGWPWI